GDKVERGQRVGLIKFGSRVNVLLPAEAELRVSVGQRVKGGKSVLAAVTAALPAVNQSKSANALPNKSDGGRS
ncbi:MAG: phosphatidylserine decarboxylase, partial [Terracidiphilus sp.]